MYCNYCGKEVYDDDTFCPFCGKRITAKKVTIDNYASLESLQKRGTMLLEDGEFSSASEYFNRIIAMDPENYYGYLGKQMADLSLNTVDDFFNYYSNLYSEEKYEQTEVCSEDKKHIDRIVNKYQIEDYLLKDDIEKRFSFSRRIGALLPCRKKQKEQIENEFANNHTLSRIKQFADKNTRRKINNIFKEYDRRIEEAKVKDEESALRVEEQYKNHLNKVDKEIETLYHDALKRREEEYNSCVKNFENVSTLDTASHLLDRFTVMNESAIGKGEDGFKDCAEYIERCNERIEEIKEENRKAEEEKKIKTRKTIIIVVAAVALMILAVVFYKNVIVPDQMYKKAKVLIEEKEFDQAMDILNELGDYKDTKQVMMDANYQKGLALMNDEKYVEAIDIFNKLGDYKESVANMTETMYVYADWLLDEKDYDKAIELFQQLGDYKESTEKIKEGTYEKALALREARKYDEALKLFDDLGDYKDVKEQFAQTEKEKRENSVTIPKLIGVNIDFAKESLDKLDLEYTIRESEKKDQKLGTVISISPEAGTVVLKKSTVDITIAKGASKYSNYAGDGNTLPLFQIGIKSTGNNLRVRSAPTTADDNKVKDAKKGEIYNVYEQLTNEGYTWYRIGNKQWVAYDTNWISRDSYVDNNLGSYEIYRAKIIDEKISVYDNPVENINQRNWLRSMTQGEIVTVYYTFNNGSHTWYKIGVNEWIKDVGGGRVVRMN